MEGCDLAFERSSVHADVRGKIDSVKNILSGSVTADEIGEIIMEENIVDKSQSQIVIRGENKRKSL
jgi:ethanolamine utilization cobalamin adenosyltransferase